MPETISSCILCGSAGLRPHLRVRAMCFDLPGEFGILACEACRFFITSPRPTHDELASYYPDDYNPHTSRDWAPKTALGRWRFNWRIRLTREFWVPPLAPGASVLEIGCGTGSFLGALRGRGW